MASSATSISFNSTTISTIAACINATLSINTTMDNTTTSNMTTMTNQQSKPGVISRIWFSTCGYTLSTDTSSVCAAAFWVVRILPTILLIVGTIGNIVNLIILKRPALSKSTATIYLQCLAVSDLVALWSSVLGLWKKLVPNTMVIEKYPLLCLLFKLLGSSSYSCSTWILTQLSVVRAILATFPFFGKRVITGFKIRVAIGTNCLINVVAQVVIVVMEQYYVKQTYGRLQCFLDDDTPIGTFWSSWILSYDIIAPFVILFISNCVIIYSLTRHGQKFEQRSGKEQTRSLNRTLVLISVYFLISFIPFQSFQLAIGQIKTEINNKEVDLYSFVNDMVFLVGSSNFAVNCVFYFMNGTLFRTEWKEMTMSLRKRLSEIFATTTSVPTDTSTNQELAASPI